MEEVPDHISPGAIRVCRNQYLAGQANCADVFLLVIVANSPSGILTPMNSAESIVLRHVATPVVPSVVHTLSGNVGAGNHRVAEIYPSVEGTEVEVVWDLWVVNTVSLAFNAIRLNRIASGHLVWWRDFPYQNPFWGATILQNGFV